MQYIATKSHDNYISSNETLSAQSQVAMFVQM